MHTEGELACFRRCTFGHVWRMFSLWGCCLHRCTFPFVVLALPSEAQRRTRQQGQAYRQSYNRSYCCCWPSKKGAHVDMSGNYCCSFPWRASSSCCFQDRFGLDCHYNMINCSSRSSCPYCVLLFLLFLLFLFLFLFLFLLLLLLLLLLVLVLLLLLLLVVVVVVLLLMPLFCHFLTWFLELYLSLGKCCCLVAPPRLFCWSSSFYVFRCILPDAPFLLWASFAYKLHCLFPSKCQIDVLTCHPMVIDRIINEKKGWELSGTSPV